jgi:hypothetical protein
VPVVQLSSCLLLRMQRFRPVGNDQPRRKTSLCQISSAHLYTASTQDTLVAPPRLTIAFIHVLILHGICLSRPLRPRQSSNHRCLIAILRCSLLLIWVLQRELREEPSSFSIPSRRRPRILRGNEQMEQAERRDSPRRKSISQRVQTTGMLEISAHSPPFWPT